MLRITVSFLYSTHIERWKARRLNSECELSISDKKTHRIIKLYRYTTLQYVQVIVSHQASIRNSSNRQMNHQIIKDFRNQESQKSNKQRTADVNAQISLVVVRRCQSNCKLFHFHLHTALTSTGSWKFAESEAATLATILQQNFLPRL